MANGTINGTTANQYIVSKIEWSSTPSTANNNSTVTASLYYRRTNYYTGTPTGGTGTFTITINGQSGSASVNFDVPNSGAWVYVCSVTKTVTHNTDGAKSITISATGGISGTTLSATYCSDTAVLDNIPRQATLTVAPDFTDEQNPTITYSNPAGNAVTALVACISLDGSRDDIAYRPVPTGGGSYTFNLTEAERNVLRNATASSNSRTVMFFLRTDIGSGMFYSTATKTLSIVNANPTFPDSEVSYADVNQAVVAITGTDQHIVQDKSSLTATFGAATANKGAKITGYTLELNGVTKTATTSGSVSFGAVNSSQDVTLSVTAKDSRGNTTTATKKVTVLAWSLPVISASIERLNNYEDETYLTVDASISSVNGKNTMAVSYKYKPSGGSYGSEVQINNKTKYTISCDKNNAYVFSITVTDRFGSDTKEFHLARGMFPLFIDTEMNAVGINEFPAEGEALKVAGGIAVFGGGVAGKLLNGVNQYTTDDGAYLLAKAGETCLGSTNNAGLLLMVNMNAPENYALCYYHYVWGVSLTIKTIGINGLNYFTNVYGTVGVTDSTGDISANCKYVVLPIFAIGEI